MIVPTSRTYSGAKDLQSMLDLLVAVRPADRITDYPSIVDLREALALTSVQGRTRLWFDAQDRIVGFAFVDHYNNLRFEFDRQAAPPGTESQIVTWGVECIRRAIQESGRSLALGASCRDDDLERIALLQRHGFMMQETRSLHMVRSLDEPIPTPQVPAGFGIRHLACEREAEALVALHRAAFGTENMTVEERLAMMGVPEYDPQLDLLAIAPDGRFAAYCTCSISQEENERTGRNEGYTDPIATHPDFQRRGLARALLLTGFHRLKQRGIDVAVLGTSSENNAMQRTAQAVGFRVQSTTLWFSKPVSQDIEPGASRRDQRKPPQAMHISRPVRPTGLIEWRIWRRMGHRSQHARSDRREWVQEDKAMSVSTMLLAGGLLLVIVGGVLLVVKRQRKVALACLTVGTVLIIVPSVLVVITSM